MVLTTTKSQESSMIYRKYEQLNSKRVPVIGLYVDPKGRAFPTVLQATPDVRDYAYDIAYRISRDEHSLEDAEAILFAEDFVFVRPLGELP